MTPKARRLIVAFTAFNILFFIANCFSWRLAGNLITKGITDAYSSEAIYFGMKNMDELESMLAGRGQPYSYEAALEMIEKHNSFFDSKNSKFALEINPALRKYLIEKKNTIQQHVNYYGYDFSSPPAPHSELALYPRMSLVNGLPAQRMTNEPKTKSETPKPEEK